jgi:hypothetical protein
MGNEMDALLAILLLKPLLECFRVFSNPVKVPSVDLSLLPELKEVPSSFCAYLHKVSMPSWQSIFSTECSVVMSSSVHPLHLLNALLVELLRTLSDSGLPV